VKTALSELCRKLGEYVYFTFKVRTWLLIAVVAMAVFPGLLIFELPLGLRMVFAYVFVGVTGLALWAVTGVMVNTTLQLVRFLLLGWKYRPKEYSAPEVDALRKKMNLPKVKVFLTDNPSIKGPFTNTITGKVYLTTAWVKKFPDSEILAILAHEFGHLKMRIRYGLEVVGAVGGVVGFSLLLSLHSVPIIVEIAEVALALLAITYVSWINERRADLTGARAVGPEGLIAVFEQLKSESKRDEGSETHPSLGDRIRRLRPLLDEGDQSRLASPNIGGVGTVLGR
jgi:Zn-dependent protease with chaperone function